MNNYQSKFVKLAVFIFLFFSAQVNAMGLFDFLEIDVLTDANGIVTLAGEPVIGAKVTLIARVVFNDEKFTVTTETDSAGRFHFNSIKAKSINTFLPSAKMVNQKITITYQDKDYLAWDMVKNNYDYNGELNDLSEPGNKTQIIPLTLNCELNDQSITRKAGTHDHIALTGMCRWEGEQQKAR